MDVFIAVCYHGYRKKPGYSKHDGTAKQNSRVSAYFEDKIDRINSKAQAFSSKKDYRPFATIW